MEKMLSAQEAQEILAPHMKRLAACIQNGWNEWIQFGQRLPKSQIPLTPSTRAFFVHNHITEQARKEFADVPSVHLADQRGFLTLTFEEKVVIRFKKFKNGNFSTSSIPTAQQQQFAYQLELPGMPPEATKLVAGYLLDNLQTSVQAVAITCSVGSDLQWILDITEPDAGHGAHEIPAQPDQPRGPRVGPKPAERRENEAGQR